MAKTVLHTGEKPFKCPECPREDKLRHQEAMSDLHTMWKLRASIFVKMAHFALVESPKSISRKI